MVIIASRKEFPNKDFPHTKVTVMDCDENPFKDSPMAEHFKDRYRLVRISILDTHPFVKRMAYQYKLVTQNPSWEPGFRAFFVLPPMFIGGDELTMDIKHRSVRDIGPGYDQITLTLRSLSERILYDLPFVIDHNKISIRAR